MCAVVLGLLSRHTLRDFTRGRACSADVTPVRITGADMSDGAAGGLR